MSNSATVVTKKPAVGVEFDPTIFQQAVTPEVTVPDDLGDITADSITAPQAVFTNLFSTNIHASSITGEAVALLRAIALGELTNVVTTNAEDNSILQYDEASERWVARQQDSLLDGVIDGGFPASVYTVGFDIDGGSP